MKKNNRAARAARFLLQCFDVAKRRREIFILGSLKEVFPSGISLRSFDYVHK